MSLRGAIIFVDLQRVLEGPKAAFFSRVPDWIWIFRAGFQASSYNCTTFRFRFRLDLYRSSEASFSPCFYFDVCQLL